MKKNDAKIWSIQKFAVSLHPLSLKNQGSPKRAQAKIDL